MMYRTKQDVDRHVSSVLARIKDEKERNARGYQIAKLYYEAKEYEIARRYLAGFLSIRENLPQAHKLMGQIHEACGQTAQAVASYKRSLELDDKQKDVVYKICEQYSKTNMDPDRAKFWAEKGEKLFPNSDVVFKLKEKAMTGQGNKNFKEMESLISAELVKRPGDVDLRIRLLKMYVTTGHVNDAYHHAVEIEQTLAYVDSLPWYEYLVDLLGIFQQEAGCSDDSVFYSLKLMAVQNLVHLTLQHADVVNAAEALHIFDLCIHQAQQIHKMTKEWQALLKEMQGQFFYMAGTLLLKRAQRNHLTWRDATGVAAACYLASHQFPPLNSRAEWFIKAPINRLKTNDRLQKISYFRCSQTGHLLNMMCRGERQQWAQDLKRHCTLPGREKLYDSLFTLREMRTLKPKSYLMQSKAFCDFEVATPTPEQVLDYDSVAHLLQPDNLHYLVWLALQHYSWRDNTQPKYEFDVFSTLQYTTTTSLENAAPESLCQLDVEVFLYATVRCAALKLQESRLILPQDGSQPEFLPTVLCKPLCSKEQADWWEAAYKLYANIAKDNFPKLRLVLQRGLEAVRIMGNHGMSVTMIVHLAKTLDERASEMKAKPDRDSASDPVIAAVETRTAHYWRKALELLHKMERHQPVRMSQERLFPEDGAKELDSKAIKSLIGDGELYMAVLAMNNKEYESALMSFEKVERPYASYYTAQVYKQLANNAVSDKTKDQLTPDVRAKYEALLIKARDAFYLTLDRLRGDKNHELNKLLSRDLDDIEIRLSRADTEEGIQNDSINLSVNSEDFESPMGLTGVQTMPVATPSRLPYLAQSTPNLKPHVRSTLSTLMDEDRPRISMSEVSGRVRPSPERLEAQMRALTLSQDTLLKTVMEQNKELIQNNKEIMDELKESRSLNKQLQDQLTQMTQARLMGGGPFLPPQGLSQTLPTGSPYMMGAPLQAGGFPYSPSPSWMPQYGYQMPSPNHAGSVRFQSVNRLGARHHPINQGDFYSGPPYSFATADLEEDVIDRDDNEEEDPYHVDGEYFVDDGTGAQSYYMQDVQDWPYGNRAGLEGKSTITYQPHMRPPVPQQGLVGAGLRGQSLQYGYRPPVPSPAMPGPGYFSSPQTHASVYPSNTTTQSSLATALASNTPGLFSAQGTGSPNLTSTVSSPAMPPNVVAGHVPGSIVMRPQMAGKSSPMTSVGQPVAAQLSAAQTPSAPRPDQPAAHPSTPTLPEGVSLLFAGRAIITAKPNEPKACSLKMFHIVRGSRPMIAVQAVTESKEVVMNHEFSAEVQVKPVMFVPDTFEWTKAGSTDRFVLKFSDSNETTGFNLAIEKVKVLLQNIAAAKDGTPSGTVSAPALAKAGQAVLQTGGSASGMLSQIAAKHKDSTNKPSLPTVPAVDAAKGDAGKNVLGGFTFKSTPIISSPATPGSDERQKAVPSGKALSSPSKSTTKPFEGFSLGGGTQIPAAQFGQDAGTPSFAGLSAGNTASPVVNRSPGVKATAGKDSPGRREDDTVDEYEPNVDFQPVIPLPDLVEVKTGEEEEDKLFSERCRLFRFDPESNQWKERGVGEMKILQHKTTKRARIVMRRDQVLKLCANHYLSGDMKLSPMAASGKSWCWNAADYADEEVKNEQLAARFKNAEIATTFKKVFEECVEKIKADSEVSSSTDVPVATAETKSPGAPKPLSELFKPAEGSWECSGCFIRNEGTVKKCPACGTLKPGVKPEDVKEEPSSTSVFGATGSGFKFGSSGFSLGSSGGFTFGSPASSSKDASAKPAADSSTGFSFGTNVSSGKNVPEKSATGIASGFTFGPLAQNNDASKPAPDSTSGVVFGGQETKKETKPSSSDAAADVGDKTADSSKPLSELFKKAEGSWDCSGCLIVNDSSVKKCPACGTLKPGVKPEEVQSTPSFKFTSGAGFSFGTQTKPAESSGSSAFTFGSSEKSEGSSGFVFGSSSSGNKPSGFSFGVTTTTTSATANEAEKKIGPQDKTLKDLLKSDSPASGTTLMKDIAQSESKTNPPASSKSLFGSSITGASAGAPGVTGSASDSFVFGSPLTKFTFTGVGPSTPSSAAKAPVVTSPKSPEVDDHGHYVNKEGEDSHIFFEPVVKLPEKVDLKTGEEEETVMFESRAKLYRFDNSEWKERGLGVVKLLHHGTNKKMRILMRRDQILKICCNHQITADMNLKPMAKTEGKAWIWHAVDFADEDRKHQQLAIRFKTPELGNKFKETFELGRQLAAEKSPVKGSQPSHQKEEPTATSAKAIADQDDDVVFVKEEKATAEQVVKARGYKLPDNFYLYEKVPPCPGCLGCVEGDEDKLVELLKNSPAPPPTRRRSPKKSESEKTAAESLFGSVPATDTKSDSAVSAPSLFGNQSGGLSFAALAQTSTTPFASKQDGNKPFSFSGAGAPVFGGKKDDGAAAGDDDEVVPSNDIHFEPIISLPEMEVKTGEEDEEVLFCQRSKLFRFDKEANQWKERGTGDIKILKHRETGAYRILQRRDQVLKISCNHLLTPDLQLKPMSTSETSWCWTAQDYAEGEARIEQFAVKFKKVDLAKEFKDMFLKCQKDMEEKEQKADVVAEIVEPSVRSSTGFTTGDKGNVYYSQQLDKTAGEEENIKVSVQESGKGDNTFHSTGGAGDAGNGEDEEEDEEEDEYEDVDDEDDEDYEDILETIFEKQATLSAFEDNNWKVLGMGDLKVLYDDDVTAHRISMETDNQTKVCNHIISKECSLSSDETRVCKWAAVDFSTDEPIKRTFMAQFSSTPALEEFIDHFHKGVQLAVESDISERDMMSTFPQEIVRPEVVCSPESKDGAGGLKFGGV